MTDLFALFESEAQRAAWAAREMPQVEMLTGGLWSLPIPIPGSPLRYTSVYCFESRDALVLIDSGVGGNESWSHLVAGLAELGATVSDIEGILVTHSHYDHVGQAARIREESGAWIGMHPADAAVLKGLDDQQSDAVERAEEEWLLSLGAPDDDAHRIAATLAAHFPNLRGSVPDRLISDGDKVLAGSFELRAIHTPGHTPGHLCFLDEATSSLFAGDHLLPRITPNISVARGQKGNPLADYLSSLAAVRNLSIRGVLPAHEWRFPDLPSRVDALTAHHEVRLAELIDVLGERADDSAWGLASRLTWSRAWDQYDGWIKVLAVTETLAHLVLLEARGLVASTSAPVRSFSLARS